MTSASPQSPHATEHEAPEPESAAQPGVHPRWILIGSLALLVGLVMGFIMSALGK